MVIIICVAVALILFARSQIRRNPGSAIIGATLGALLFFTLVL